MLKSLTMSLLIVATVFAVFLTIEVQTGYAENKTIEFGYIDPPFELSLKTTNGNFGSDAIFAQVFKKQLEDSSGQKIKVKLFPSGQLGSFREMFEMTKQGSLNMVSCNSSVINTWVPETMVVAIPYLFKDINVFFEMMNSPRADELNNVIRKKTGVRPLAWYSAGPYYNFMTVKKKVQVPGDLKGLKIRVQESPYMVQLVKLTGASPTPIAWGELYTSLQQGVIDGIVTGIPWLTDIGAEKIIKHINVAHPILGPSIFGINEKLFQSFSKYEQGLILAAARQAILIQAAMTNYGHNLWVSFMQQQGIDVHFPSQKESEEWVKILRDPMAEWTAKKIGKEWVDKYLKLTKEVENEIYSLK